MNKLRGLLQVYVYPNLLPDPEIDGEDYITFGQQLAQLHRIIRTWPEVDAFPIDTWMITNLKDEETARVVNTAAKNSPEILTWWEIEKPYEYNLGGIEWVRYADYLPIIGDRFTYQYTGSYEANFQEWAAADWRNGEDAYTYEIVQREFIGNEDEDFHMVLLILKSVRNEDIRARFVHTPAQISREKQQAFEQWSIENKALMDALKEKYDAIRTE